MGSCVAVLLGHDCCCVGCVTLTAFLLLKDFLCFSFNAEVLQLICTISWTKRDHNSQRSDTVLAMNCETKASEHFSKLCLLCSFWARICRCWVHCWNGGSEDMGSSVELKGNTRGKRGKWSNSLVEIRSAAGWRSGRGSYLLSLLWQRGASYPLTCRKKSNRKISCPPCKHRWRISWSVQGYLSSRQCICKDPEGLHNLKLI